MGRSFGRSEIICADDEGLYEIEPEARVGDALAGLAGALDFSNGVYCLQLMSPAETRSISKDDHPLQSEAGWSTATFNLNELFDTNDDPNTQDVILSASEYQLRLQKRALAVHNQLGEPTLLGIQEAENPDTLLALIACPEIQADYQFVMLEGPDQRGLDSALLYRSDQVRLLEYESRQGCSGLVDGLGPDGNLDMNDPKNALTCDRDGDGKLDGNRLFSRPPLLAHVIIEPFPGSDRNGSVSVDLWLVVNHWLSKLHDDDSHAYSLARRLEEAQFLRDWMEEIRQENPAANLIILGDLNDDPDSSPVKLLSEGGFVQSISWAARSERYTYIYRGISQVMDYTLLDLNPEVAPLGIEIVHINTDFPEAFSAVADSAHRSSDHDPVVIRYSHFDKFAYFPLIAR